MPSSDRFAKLLDVAREDSSEKRRELLREVTDLFFESEDSQSPVENHLFGELIGKVAFELDQEVRKELASRFSHSSAPRQLAVALANDVIEVAAPVLRHSRALTDTDLVALVESKGDSHRMAVTQREQVSEVVAGALVTHGGDEVVASLVSNAGARIAEETYDRIIERAETSALIQAAAARAETISPHHLNQLFLIVEGPMRKEVMGRFSRYAPEDIERAMERAKTRVSVNHGALPADFEAANRAIAATKARGALTPTLLPTLWRNREHTQCLLAMADLFGVEFGLVQRLIDRKDVDALAMLSRACGFDRALFVTLAVLILGESGMGQAKTLGDLYNDVPVEAAQRAIRFMKVRAATEKAA